MFKRENLVGLLLLGLCVVVGAVMVQAIVTGELPEVNLPGWLVWPLGAIFIGGIAYGFFRQFLDRRSTGGGQAWPSPMTGEKTLRDRLPGRKQGPDHSQDPDSEDR